MILDRIFERRASLENPSTNLADPANWLFHALGASPSASKIIVNDRNVNQITAYWSAVNTISDTLAELPIKLVHIKKNGQSKVIKSHPALPLLQLSPNPMMNAVVSKSTVQAHTLGWGNGYMWVRRNRLKVPLELWPLLPNETTAVKEGKRLWFETRLDIGKTRIPSADVIHVPALSRNGILGMSIIAEQREMLGAIMATQNFASRFFANGAKAGGLVSYPGKVRDPEKIREAIERAAGGDNAHGLLVLDNDAKFQQFAIPPEDAQFLQTREFGVDEVARMFRLPLHFLNKMGQATFNNLEMMGTHFAQYTMMPWLIRWEQELSRKLLTPAEIQRGYRFKFNLGALMRGDIKTRSEVYAKAIQFGWMTRNEVRALEDMNPLDGLDDPLVPLNLGVVGEEAPEPEPAPEPDDEPADDDDTEGDDENEDDTDEESEDDARHFLVLSAAAQRCVNREAKAIGRIWKRHDTDEARAGAVSEFYDQHAAIMVENLAMSADDAAQYCIRHGLELFDDEPVDDVLIRWGSESVADLVNQLSGGTT